jgi:hypothetical protein
LCFSFRSLSGVQRPDVLAYYSEIFVYLLKSSPVLLFQVAVWSMVGYVVGLGDRYVVRLGSVNTLMLECCHLSDDGHISGVWFSQHALKGFDEEHGQVCCWSGRRCSGFRVRPPVAKITSMLLVWEQG